MINKIEAFLNIFFRVKGKHIFALFLGLCIPLLPIQGFMAFFLGMRILGLDIERKNSIISLLSLPFRKKELFFLSWLSGLFLILVSSLVGGIFSGTTTLYSIVYLFIFFTFYFGVATYFASGERSLFGMSLLVLAVDAILLSVPGYSYISVLTQGNQLFSAIFSLLVLGIGYYGFVYNYEG